MWQNLGMAYYVAQEVSRPPLQHFETRRGSARSIGMPAQLLCRRMIQQAYHDALTCGPDGRPTAGALDAWAWLAARTDWTLRSGPIPPEDARQEFGGTFEWACRWLEEDPSAIREHGLPPPRPVVFVKRPRDREWVRGMPEIKRRWEVQASRGRRAESAMPVDSVG